MPYALIGKIAEEHDANVGVKDRQKAEDVDKIDEVDTLEEAKRIAAAGGYVKDGQWHVVVGWQEV